MAVKHDNTVYIDAPSAPPLSPVTLAAHAFKGVFLSPLYWLLAYRYPTPGLRFRRRSARMGLRALIGTRNMSHLRTAYNLLFFPMDSTRYFELGTLWDFLTPASPLSGKYLDISSPRLFPLALILANPNLRATLLNPDPSDLDATSTLARLLKVHRRCAFSADLIDHVEYAPESFDLISSVSVVEHIPNDTDAIERAWSLLKTGGRLLVTVPCAAKSYEQFINKNFYGVLAPDQLGYVFWQRLYDETLLNKNIFSVTGPPSHMAIYGEKISGTLFRNSTQKRASRAYPFWIEPLMMGRDFAFFDSISSLPGEGVAAMELTKR